MSDQDLPGGDLDPAVAADAPTAGAADASPPPPPAPPSGAVAPRPARKRVAKKKAAPPARGAAAPAQDRPPRTPKAPPPIDEGKATRNGIIVIAVTVVIGLVIFGKGIQQQDADVRTAASSATSSTLPGISTPESDRNAPPSVTSPEQGTTIPQVVVTKVPPKDIKIVVANGVDPSKTIAGPNADKLTAQGYVVTNKTDLPTTSDKSFVYYSGDLQAEAQAVAKVLGLPDSAVVAMPKTPAVPVNGAQILVVIGKDQA